MSPDVDAPVVACLAVLDGLALYGQLYGIDWGLLGDAKYVSVR
jgi:hypothetical protein